MWSEAVLTQAQTDPQAPAFWGSAEDWAKEQAQSHELAQAHSVTLVARTLKWLHGHLSGLRSDLVQEALTTQIQVSGSILWQQPVDWCHSVPAEYI